MNKIVIPVERPRRVYRISVSILFFLQGLCFASWASRIPSIQQQFQISNSVLGAILFALPAGSMLCLIFSGALVTRYGSKKIAGNAVLVYGLILPLIGFSTSIGMLVVSLVLFGIAGNMANIAINTQAVQVESKYGRKILASFHGLWSVAGFLAAGIGTFMIGRRVPPSTHFLLVSATIAATIALIFPYLFPDVKIKRVSGPLFVKPDKPLLKLGILAFCCMMCEGTMFDWSGIYFQKVVKAKEDLIGAGYTAFMCAMAGGRFVGDWVANRLRFRKTIFVGALLVTGGLSLAVIAPFVFPSIIGFMLVGLGVSSMVPLIYSEAGKSETISAGMALTAVSSIGFFGFLVGPPLIGVIAGIAGLRISFLLVAAIGLFIAVMIQMGGRPRTQSHPE